VEAINYIKLSELSAKIEDVFKRSFSNEYFWIVAEISGHKFYPDTDRHYFDLVEKTIGSEVEVAKFKSKSWSEGSANIAHFETQTGQTFQSGIQVLIKVKVEYHSLYGLSLTLIDIDTTFTLGNIEKQRRATLQKLVSDNSDFIKFIDDEYITRNKELELPLVIQRIALIASPNSEGYSDFIHTIKNNQHNYKFEVDNYFSTVQGKDAEKELINTLISIHQSNKKYDCVVMIRGGGAKTDFLVFDTYHLARAVAKFPIPIITGIGHHKDVSIVDLMAHSPTKTPTKCAELIISHNKYFEEVVLNIQNNILIKAQQLLSNTKSAIQNTQINLVSNVQQLLKKENSEIDNLNTNIINFSKDYLSEKNNILISETILFANKPQLIINSKLQQLEYINHNIKTQSIKNISNKTEVLNHYVKVMKLMSPVNILKKGFAIISVNEKVINTTNAIEIGNVLKINMYKTELEAEVKNKITTDGKKYDV
jgi:exodeoxyribonuclease VII large subunit